MGLLKRIEFWWEERQIHKAYAGRSEEHEDQEYWDKLWHLDQKRRHYSDRKLIAKAQRHYVPIPPESDKDAFWKEEDDDNWFFDREGSQPPQKRSKSREKGQS